MRQIAIVVAIGFAIAVFLFLAIFEIEARHQGTWESKTLLNGYSKAGYADPRWNHMAERALLVYAEKASIENPPNGSWEEIIATNCGAAINAGCGDPMIRYLFIRYSMTRTNSFKRVAEEYMRLAPDMEKTPYSPVQKFYVLNRAIMAASDAYGPKASKTEDALARLGPDMRSEMRASLADKTIPPEEILGVCHEALLLFDSRPDDYARIYSEMEPLLFTNWGTNSISWQIKGHAYIQMAWNGRGYGLASTVSSNGWHIFRQDLGIARDALDQAWTNNPHESGIADDMMVAQLGSGRDPQAMEQWFARAMTLNTNDYFACSEMVYYLEPKWYGSIPDMIYFGRACATNLNWGGRVPLVLVLAHEEARGYQDQAVQSNYWDLPYVRSDIELAYNRFFETDPQAEDIAVQHALYDYRTKRWADFVKVAPTVRPSDYYLLDGAHNFRRMTRYAKYMAKTGSPTR